MTMTPIPATSSKAKRIAAASAIAAAIAVPCEGIRRVAYYDPPGVLTVCRGHTGADIEAGKLYSLAECDQFFTDDMRKAVIKVDDCIPGLPEEPLAALGDMTFNTGPKWVCDASGSTLARRAKAQDWSGMCNAALLYDKARIAGMLVALPGLTRRRGIERTLCLEGFRWSGDLIGWTQ